MSGTVLGGPLSFSASVTALPWYYDVSSESRPAHSTLRASAERLFELGDHAVEGGDVESLGDDGAVVRTAVPSRLTRKGAGQLRGSGALALTKKEVFGMYVIRATS